jgi:hypothetical protein
MMLDNKGARISAERKVHMAYDSKRVEPVAGSEGEGYI